MGVAAKLGAIDLVFPNFSGLEPDGDAHAGNGVLGDAHGDDFEGMDDIFGTDVRDDRLVNDDVKLVVELNIVFTTGIIWIDTEYVAGADQLHVLLAEFAVLSGVTEVPVELLGDDL